MDLDGKYIVSVEVNIDTFCLPRSIVTVDTHASVNFLAELIDKSLKWQVEFLDTVIYKGPTTRNSEQNLFTIQFIVKVVAVAILVIYQVVFMNCIKMIRNANTGILQR